MIYKAMVIPEKMGRVDMQGNQCRVAGCQIKGQTDRKTSLHTCSRPV